MRKNRFAAFLLWAVLALACWGMALGGFLANRQGNREFTAYYDNTVLTGKEMVLSGNFPGSQRRDGGSFPPAAYPGKFSLEWR